MNFSHYTYEPGHSISYKITCAPSEDLDQPAHPRRLIRVFAFRWKTLWIFGYPQSAMRRLWSACADAQADQSLRRAHMQSCRKRWAPANMCNNKYTWLTCGQFICCGLKGHDTTRKLSTNLHWQKAFYDFVLTSHQHKSLLKSGLLLGKCLFFLLELTPFQKEGKTILTEFLPPESVSVTL